MAGEMYDEDPGEERSFDAAIGCDVIVVRSEDEGTFSAISQPIGDDCGSTNTDGSAQIDAYAFEAWGAVVDGEDEDIGFSVSIAGEHSWRSGVSPHGERITTAFSVAMTGEVPGPFEADAVFFNDSWSLTWGGREGC